MGDVLSYMAFPLLAVFAPWVVAAVAMAGRLGHPSYAENWVRTRRETGGLYLALALVASLGLFSGGAEPGQWITGPLCSALGLWVLWFAGVRQQRWALACGAAAVSVVATVAALVVGG